MTDEVEDDMSDLDDEMKAEIESANEYVRTKVRQPPVPSPAIQELILWRAAKKAEEEVGPEPVVPPEEWERARQERKAYHAQLEADEARKFTPMADREKVETDDRET